jgi:hypothetical protein
MGVTLARASYLNWFGLRLVHGTEAPCKYTAHIKRRLEVVAIPPDAVAISSAPFKND